MENISIIIPCYKRKKELFQCLKKISESDNLGKNFNYEVIVVESQSKVLGRLIKNFKNLKIRYFWLKERGIARAKNYGAKKAKYEILCFCDSDIEVKKDTLWETILTFKNNPYAGLISGKVFWKETKKLDRPSKTDRFFKYKGHIFAEFSYGRYIACLKKCFFDAKGFDDKLFNMRGEGVDLSVKFWRAGYPLVYNPKIQVFHKKKAPFSVTRQIKEKDTLLFQSMILHSYKYNNWNLEKIPYLAISLNEWGRKLFGKYLPYKIIESAAKLIDWILENKNKIISSKKEIPKIFDFKPEDMFTDKKLVLECLKSAPARIEKIKRSA